MFVILAIIGYIQAAQERSDYPSGSSSSSAALESGYMEGCVINSNLQAYCSCTYNGLVQEYGISGFMDNIPRLTRAEFTPADSAIVSRCAKLINI